MDTQTGAGVPQSTRKTLDIDQNFAYWLTHVNYLYDRKACRIYDSVAGLTTSQWRVMALIAKLGPVQAVDLAHSSTLDEGAISRAARFLREKGLADRELDGHDGRRINLFLTEKGFACYRQIKKETHELQQTLFEGVDERELRGFFNILHQLENRLVVSKD